MSTSSRRDIDVIDLKLGPDDDDVEILRTRKTKKLISARFRPAAAERPVQVRHVLNLGGLV
jgi:hypothetical protein